MNPGAPIPEAGMPAPAHPIAVAPPRPARLWVKVLAVMLIFFLGVGTGAVGSVALIIHWMKRHEAVTDWSSARLKDLDDRLKLTAEQKEKLQPVILRAGERFQAIGNRTFEEIAADSQEVRADIEKELNPEQKKKFEKLRPLVTLKLREWVQKQLVARHSSAGEPASTSPTKPVSATPPSANPPPTSPVPETSVSSEAVERK